MSWNSICFGGILFSRFQVATTKYRGCYLGMTTKTTTTWKQRKAHINHGRKINSKNIKNVFLLCFILINLINRYYIKLLTTSKSVGILKENMEMLWLSLIKSMLKIYSWECNIKVRDRILLKEEICVSLTQKAAVRGLLLDMFQETNNLIKEKCVY